MFLFLTADEIVEKITHLEEVLTNGAQSASDPSTGSATFYTVGQQRQILDALYSRYEALTGRKLRDRRLVVVNIDARRA